MTKSTDPDPIGNIFLCVDVDIYHPQVLRIARMKGAQIVIASSSSTPISSAATC